VVISRIDIRRYGAEEPDLLLRAFAGTLGRWLVDGFNVDDFH
jgi:hypothetical protein